MSTAASFFRALLVVLVLAFIGFTCAESSSSPWSPVSTTTDEQAASPEPSMSHAAGALRNGTSLVVFGGCTSSCCFAPIDSLWELRVAPDSLTDGRWHRLTPASGTEAPGPRFSAATAVDPREDCMYMFGGQDASQAFLSELWKLELVKEEMGEGAHQARWTRLRTPRLHTPPSRGAASLSLLGSGRHLLVYGGFGRDGPRNDAWVLDTTRPSEGWKRLAVKGEGEAPRRWHHSAVAVDDGRRVVVVGGVDVDGKDKGDAWTLEVDVGGGTAVWASLVNEGEGIPPRHGHAALVAAAINKEVASSFVVFGGVNTTANTLPESFLADAYRLDVGAAEWLPLKGDGGGPGARAYAAVGHGPRHSVVFGGFAGYLGDVDDRLQGDVWVFQHDGGGVGMEGPRGVVQIE